MTASTTPQLPSTMPKDGRKFLVFLKRKTKGKIRSKGYNRDAKWRGNCWWLIDQAHDPFREKDVDFWVDYYGS